MEIYKITNLINGKSYIGQTIYCFKIRYDSSNWWETKAMNTHLKNSILKYGIENFSVQILENDIKTKEILNEREIFFIDFYQCIYPLGYNLMQGGQEIVDRAHNETTKDKISLASRKRNRDANFKLKNHKDGKVYEFTNISRFSKENGLSVSMIVNIFAGKNKRNKFWTLPETKLKHWLLKSPEGELFDLLEGEYRPFCDKRRLSRRALLEGMSKGWKHKKWTLIKTYEA